MTNIALLARVLLLGLFATPAGAEPPTRAKFPDGLYSLFSDADYPDDAIRNNEQGSVAFRLDIASDGKVGSCSILSSSGSTILDVATCRILMERARFQPARDAAGKPTSDSYNGRITWRLPEDQIPPRMNAALMLWTTCLYGEAAKLTPGDLPSSEAAARSFAPCIGLEALVAKEMKASPPLTEQRKALAPSLERSLDTIRTSLKSEPENRAPVPK